MGDFPRRFRKTHVHLACFRLPLTATYENVTGRGLRFWWYARWWYRLNYYAQARSNPDSKWGFLVQQGPSQGALIKQHDKRKQLRARSSGTAVL